LTRTVRHSDRFASSSSSRPFSVSPAPISSLAASIACSAPTVPVSGANTPIVEHCTSSTSPSSG
jgi:hypothetical protein